MKYAENKRVGGLPALKYTSEFFPNFKFQFFNTS